jgi:predicted deacylase
MNDVGPDMTRHGPDSPSVAVVAGVHGDEPSGVRAVRRLRAAAEAGDLELERGVLFAIANPPAVAAGERYLDSDMNRSFPGDTDGNREERLAAALVEKTRGMLTLSLHATHSSADPIAMLDSRQPGLLEYAAALPVPYVVDHANGEPGTHSETNDVLTVEAGAQGTEAAAATAEKLALEFLKEADVLPGTPDSTDSSYFSMADPVPKPPSEAYELLVENFERVEAGQVFARAAGEPLRAAETFYPILMSAYGYEDVFGYTGEWLGDGVEAARAAIEAL